ncbi:acyltransferase family protein [Synechococcus sp. Tobar12-5m-g]|uniref:acyltransferase family protein n=1 Tax=unclassified Synechococcus TaxID=2626047 RepID=UPI0020CBF247|nr:MULTISPECIES: acyltransferase family protein [unclassified Synechococcus]MCP9772731.1 acyltransferase family protein [Synechococcus sp. Tobar12-5m-g]MCP9873632.1 acyltransferase family protein [Synechococcus sp. Cruz CV-v-12]
MTHLVRSHDLDLLRLMAVALLITFHSAAVFYEGELGSFYVLNAESSVGLSIFIQFVHQWHMPLFFFLAGAASWYSLQTRSQGEYVRQRLRRLLLPLLIGILVLVPPQVYLHELQIGGENSSFLRFYPKFFDGIRPYGHFEWGHLWFLAYLLVISFVCLPVMLQLSGESMSTDGSPLPLETHGLGSLIVLAVPLMAVEAVLRPHWIGFQNLYDDWANLLLYLLYFCYGYLFCHDTRLWSALDEHRWLLSVTAGLAMALLIVLSITKMVPGRAYSAPYMVYQGFRGLNSWCWVLALLALARPYRTFSHPILSYGNRVAFSVYLFHQPLIVIIAFFVVPLSLDIAAKFVLISLLSLLFSVGLHEGLIRGAEVVREWH